MLTAGAKAVCVIVYETGGLSAELVGIALSLGGALSAGAVWFIERRTVYIDVPNGTPKPAGGEEIW